MLAEFGADLLDPILTLALGLMIVRVLLQLSHADFYNPISQGVVRITDAVLKPLRAVLPKTGAIDLAGLIGAFAVALIYVFVFRTLVGAPWPNPIFLLTVVLANIARTTLYLYWGCLMVIFVVSWVAPSSHHPAVVLTRQLSEPILAPVRSVIPPVGGLDFSMLVVFIVINAIIRALSHVPPF